MKREELKTLDLLCDMGVDVNGNRNLQPYKAYDIDEVNLVIKELEAENAKLKSLALHGMFGYACAKMNVLVEKQDYRFGSGKIYKDFSRWRRLSRLWREAYRKAKKKLKEEK